MTQELPRLRNLSNVRSEDVWRPIYDEMLPRVYHYFAYRVGDRRTAEDLAATTFEKAWKARRQFKREKGAVDQWLFGIAQRVLADHYRRQELCARDIESHSIETDFSLEQTVENARRYLKLNRLLDNLPDRSRELISLKYGGGLNNREIASLTGLTESNVGTILHRVVEDLRKQWEDDNE